MNHILHLNAQWCVIGPVVYLVLGCSGTTYYSPDTGERVSIGDDTCPILADLPKMSSECMEIGGQVYHYANDSAPNNSSVLEPWLSGQSLCFGGYAGRTHSSAGDEEEQRWDYGVGVSIMLSQWVGDDVVLFDAQAFDGVRFTLADGPHLSLLQFEVTADQPAEDEHVHFRNLDLVLHAGVNEVRFEQLHLDGNRRTMRFTDYHIDLIQWNMMPPAEGGFEFTTCIDDIQVFSDEK